MKKLLAGLIIGSIAATLTLDAEAQRRLGGGRNLGRQSAPVQQRQATPPATPQQQQATPPSGQQAAPSQQQTPAATAARSGAGATAAARSPMRGALMGLAAGLGIAALASWLGFGEQLAMLLTVVLIGLVLMTILGFVLRRTRSAQPAYGASGTSRGPGTYAQVGYETTPAPVQRVEPTRRVEPAPLARPGSAMDEFARPSAAVRGAPWGVPAGFDVERFLANAKSHYAKLQRAWDTGNLDELSEFTTSDMFIALTHELRARAGHSRTEVVALDAELLGIESSPNEHIASVKFDGTLSVDGEVERVSEVWNLSKPVSGSGGWVLAGIQQLA
jgi:predicted lipid-binding transport protein (Tim44 family)